MYNKIASIILNSGKAAGWSDVYVSQPDTLKESLAGKAFLLAEISGKKSEAKKIFDFLVDSLQDNYYNDEKIMLRGKIEGLKIENIFEAALSKVNKSLADFLLEQKIKLDVSATNLTMGVVYENKLHFANFGRNRSLLLYKHGDRHEIINVEANAAEVQGLEKEPDSASVKTPNFFSSVISGEIPVDSYFLFTNETMPEYLSGKDIVAIVTKLPPITAAEQIKNILAGINSYVPFLGIIIKNTMGLPGIEMKEEVEERVQTAHGSISSLNYTEQKTEEMLAPAGLINLSQMVKKAKKAWQDNHPAKAPARPYKQEEKIMVQPTINLGTVKSLNTVRSDSFFIKEKIFFKKNPGRIIIWFKNFGQKIASIKIGSRLKSWLVDLRQKKRLLSVTLGAVTIVLVISIAFGVVSHRHKVAQDKLNEIIAQVEEKKSFIDSHLLYNDETGANTALLEVQALVSSLPRDKKGDAANYEKLQGELSELEEKVQKVHHVQASKVNDLAGLGVKNIIFAGSDSLGTIFGASDKFVYGLWPDSASSTRAEIVEAVSLSRPQFDSKNILLYYWDNAKQVIQYNPKTKEKVAISLPEFPAGASIISFKVYNRNLYALDVANSQLYRLVRGQSGFGTADAWLKEEADISQAGDLWVDGDVYILGQNGSLAKFYTGHPTDFSTAAISPVMTGANKLLVGAKSFYIFEPSSKRLVVLAKEDGHLMAQYVVDSLTAPQDVAVDENGHAAYFLDNEAIYRIDLSSQ